MADDRKPKQEERRTNSRRKFGYYMRVIDNSTQELLGYLADISPRGFKLDSNHALMVNKDYQMRLDLTPDISERPFIIFTARARWSQPDMTDPYAHNEGFQIVGISAHDNEIYQRIVEKYGVADGRW